MVDWDKLLNQTECDECHKEVEKGEGMIAEGKFWHRDTCYRNYQKKVIAEYEWDEYKTAYEPEMVCPYCGYVNGDSWEYSDNDDARSCGRCEREFEYSRNIETSYSTKPKEG